MVFDYWRRFYAYRLFLTIKVCCFVFVPQFLYHLCILSCCTFLGRNDMLRFDQNSTNILYT